MDASSAAQQQQLQQQQHLTHLLWALTQPDTATIRSAEQQLKPLLRQASQMPVLWQIVVTTAPTDIGIRQVACILLKKRLPQHYSRSNDKQAWMHQVLQALAVEPSRPVRSGLLGIVAALAHVDASNPSKDLLVFLASAATSTDPNARELCFLLIQEMSETIGHHWKPYLNDLVQLFGLVFNSNTIETSPLVLKAATQAVGQLMAFWSDEDDQIAAFTPFLPAMLQIALQQASAASDDDDDECSLAAAVLDTLYELAYSPAQALQGMVPAMMEFSLQILSNRSLELRIRDAAALVIATTAEAKPKTLGRATVILGNILDVLFHLMQESPERAAGALFESNPAWKQDLEGSMAATPEDGDDGDFDSPTETSMAQGTLDMLACEIPKKYIWEPLLQRCLVRMSDASSAQARQAGVAGLGVIAEGCAEPLTQCLGHVLPLVFAAARDPAPQVRECACFCLGQISEHCQPDILQYSAQILPIMFALLDDQSVAVQVTSCYVLEMFCERLAPDAVRPLLDPLVRKLASMLEATTKRSVQEMTVAALAATAVAAEEEFAPYVPGVANLMIKLMQVRDSNLYGLRGRALECMGHMAIAVGRDNFRAYFPATMQCALEGLTLDSTELQEFAYAVFANLAKVMKTEFAPALPDLVPHLIQVIDQDEGQLEKSDEGPGDFGGLDDSEDEEDGQYVLHVRTALLEVKKGAITALGEMAAHTGTSFCPYLEECMQVLQKAAGNWHPIIKVEVADAFPAMIVPSIDAYHNGELRWTKGDVSGPSPLSAHSAALVQAVLTEEIALMKAEDKSVVGKACEATQTVIELCGPHALAPVAQECIACVHQLLTKTAVCYTEEAMFGEVPDDDDDHDVVMQSACDLIGAFCRVMGPHFVPYLPEFLPAICEYGKSSRPPADRSMAVGCLSEIAQELEGAIFEYWHSVFLPAILAGLADSEDIVRRNAAFCAGVSCEHLKDRVGGDYQAILQQMGPLFSLDANSSDSAAACIDNAAAAVARMIMASPSHVPLAQVLPAMLHVLPLKSDMTENQTVYTCLLGLLQMNHPDMMANVAEVKRVFEEACNRESKVDDEIKNKLRAALQVLQ